MSLRNRAIKGKSFNHPFAKSDLATPMSDQEKEIAIRVGNWDHLIEAHMRLGCSIAGRYVKFGGDPDEMVSAAMLGICDAVDRFKKDKTKTDNITGYIIAYIHQHCSKTLRRDRAVPSPQRRKFTKTEELRDAIENDFNIVDFDDLLEMIIKDERDAMIVDLRRQGFTDEMISKETGIPRATITMVRLNLLKRYRSYNV